MAAFHIVTAIIGAGVLGLPHAMSMLGWLGGSAALVAFFAVTLWCSAMLSDMHEVDGRRHSTYGEAVVAVLGARSAGGRGVAEGACERRAAGAVPGCLLAGAPHSPNHSPLSQCPRRRRAACSWRLQRRWSAALPVLSPGRLTLCRARSPFPFSTARRAGRGSAVAVTVCQLLNLVLSAIGYTVAAGESLK
jgi:hypothetical protein